MCFTVFLKSICNCGPQISVSIKYNLRFLFNRQILGSLPQIFWFKVWVWGLGICISINILGIFSSLRIHLFLSSKGSKDILLNIFLGRSVPEKKKMCVCVCAHVCVCVYVCRTIPKPQAQQDGPPVFRGVWAATKLKYMTPGLWAHRPLTFQPTQALHLTRSVSCNPTLAHRMSPARR